MNKHWIDRVVRLGGLDFHVLLTLMFRSWSIIAGGAMVLLIPIWFDKVEQGYYYTFSSLIALQVFFELGMNQVVVQIVSHELAHVTRTEHGGLEGDSLHIDRITSLVHLLRFWYAVAAVLFCVGVACAGVLFFERQGELGSHEWLPIWLLLVLSASINLYLSPSLAVMEGFGDMGHVARMRLTQSIMGYLCMWSALSLGAGLWAVPLVPLISAAFTGHWLRTRAPSVRWLKARALPDANRINWHTEIFPFQWRVAVSWISGYFIFQLFVPLIFRHQGAVEAGRLGIALAIFNALVTVGMSWVNAKLPQFTRLIALGKRSDLNNLFWAVTVRSMGFSFVASATVVGVVSWLDWIGVEVVARMASPMVMLCLALATFANSFVFAAAAFMRAHRAEPMLPVSVVGAALTLPAVYFGSLHSVTLTMVLYLAISTGICLPWTVKLFLPFLRRTA